MLIVHLSDIHFKKGDVTTVHDPNFHLRNEILRDLAALRARLGRADLVVVSGDVAFAGQPEEFEFATDWLKQACDACSADFRNVFVVPGNHDVDRNIADEDLIQLIHRDIKGTSESGLDNKIRRYLTKPEAAALLYRSLNAYNVFAQQFFCDMLPSERTRIDRSFELNDGSTLKLWGVNSAFVSSSADRDDLCVDPATFQITRHAAIVNMVVTHHHPSWLRQRQRVEDHYGDVAQIQLFGHIHTNRILRDEKFIRFTASALHPDRTESNWEPGYNVLQVEVEREGGERRLHVKAHVRVWQESPTQFRAKMNGEETFFEHWIKLEPWEASHVADAPHTTTSEPPEAGRSDPSPNVETMSVLRELGIRFYRLTFSQKSEIAGRLGLLEDQDMSAPDFERFRRVFVRAGERKKLADLKRAIEEAEGQTKR